MGILDYKVAAIEGRNFVIMVTQVPIMTMVDTQIHRFSREEYRQMAALGFFEGKRVELLDGEILDMAAQAEPHVYAISILNRFLIKNLPESFQVRCQAPMEAGPTSDPEPDLAVVSQTRQDADAPPTTAIFVIEVAETSLTRDRVKASKYAGAGVSEYWIVNLENRVIEQHLGPSRMPDGQPYYETVRTIRADENISCTVLPLPAREVELFLPPF